MISKCSRGIWEICIVMEHKEEWCPKAQTHSKLLCRLNCAGIIIQLFAIPPTPPPPKKKKKTNNIKCKCTHTHTQHLSRWDSSTNGSQEMGRYIVHVAYRRESIAKLFGMRCIVPPHAHNLGAHLHQLVAQISCHFPLDLCLHIHQQQRFLIKKNASPYCFERKHERQKCFRKAQVSPQASEQKIT
jgi:hypothetical protein